MEIFKRDLKGFSSLILTLFKIEVSDVNKNFALTSLDHPFVLREGEKQFMTVYF